MIKSKKSKLIPLINRPMNAAKMKLMFAFYQHVQEGVIITSASYLTDC